MASAQRERDLEKSPVDFAAYVAVISFFLDVIQRFISCSSRTAMLGSGRGGVGGGPSPLHRPSPAGRRCTRFCARLCVAWDVWR